MEIAKKHQSYHRNSFRNTWQLYAISLLPLVYLLIFKYIPMLGAQIAFKNYSVVDGLQSYEFCAGAYYKVAAASFFLGELMDLMPFSRMPSKITLISHPW